MRGTHWRAVRVALAVTSVMGLALVPVGQAASAARGMPAPPRVTISSPTAKPSPEGDSASVDATAAVSDTQDVDINKDGNDFAYFTASPKTGTLSSKAGDCQRDQPRGWNRHRFHRQLQ